MLTFVEKKLGLAIITFFAVAAVLIVVVIIPSYKKILELDREKAKMRASLESNTEQAINFHLATKQLEKLKAEAPDFSSHIFPAGQELQLISSIEKLAVDQGVTEKITGSNLDTKEKSILKISMTVSGEYRNVLAFLNDLEHIPFFLNIQTLFFSPLQNSNQVTTNLDLSLYVGN